MYSLEQQPTNAQSNHQRAVNHPHNTYRCYIRTPDMKCKVENVSTDQSVAELKQQIKNVLNLESEVQAQAIKLVVNETELTDDMNLSVHLFQNAIIHVLVSMPKNSEDSNDKKMHLLIKQPPISSLPQTIQEWPVQLPISELKSTIIKFYQQKHPSNPIASLSVNDLYLVYGGKILVDSNTILDYGIQENGVIYVVNGKIYAREVTKQEAERRIEEVKRGQYNEVQNVHNFGESGSNEFAQQNSAINESQDVVFNIIENIVHDEDSDVEGETAGDLTRSQKIIRRYDSLNRPLTAGNEEDDVVTEEQPQEEQVEIVSSNAQNQQAMNQDGSQLNSANHHQNNQVDEGNQEEKRPNFQSQVADGNEATSQPEQQEAVHQYVSSVSQKIVNIQGESVDEEEESSQNNVQGATQSLQDQPDSVPQNDENQDEDLLL